MSRKNQKDSLIRKCSDNIIPRVTYLCESYASALYLEQKPIQKQLCSKVNKQTVAQTKPHFLPAAALYAVAASQKPLMNATSIRVVKSYCVESRRRFCRDSHFYYPAKLSQIWDNRCNLLLSLPIKLKVNRFQDSFQSVASLSMQKKAECQHCGAEKNFALFQLRSSSLKF